MKSDDPKNAVPLARQQSAQEFLRESSQFRLGELPTESSHPLTTQLSELAQKDLAAAIRLFKDVEILALGNLHHSHAQIEQLSLDMLACLREGGRLFFCGCGATGRLSISLESNWRESLQNHLRMDLSEKLIGFIAGGDYALVKSIENFEDHPEYGSKQLLELGFAENDMLVSCTEGGETPFVIGASLRAAEISKRQTYFLFCNTKESLEHIDRSQEVFKNPRIQSISLFTGPQAICGSTRLQASSNLYFACGIALFSAQKNLLTEAFEKIDLPITGAITGTITGAINNYIQFLDASDLTSLTRLIETEANAYLNKSFLTYHVQNNAISILTDLTERSPTFNLLSVENKDESQQNAATANLCIDRTENSLQAWQNILKRNPRALEWPELEDKFNQKVMLGFDFSRSPQKYRELLTAGHTHEHIEMSLESCQMQIKNLTQNKILCELKAPQSILEQNLFLKLIFNMTSTLAQCLNNRVQGNMMLFVKPSNKKLIDRSVRFTAQILHDKYKQDADYAKLVECVFEASKNLHAEESVVLKSVQIYLAAKQKN
jgi:N-acetylmuramic acid 6-phosphate etherase